jgi:hypothetical protein
MTLVKKQKETAKHLVWLAHRGCPVDILDIESPVRIEQNTGDDVSRIFDLPGGLAGCVLDLRIINEGPGLRSIRELKFEMGGFDCLLLQDPRESRAHYKNLYRFPGEALEFSRDVVLNHVLRRDTILLPNHPLSGLLLGVGSPMPPEIRHGASVTGILSIITDSGSPGICAMELLADRSLRDPLKTKKRRRANGGLFERLPVTEDLFSAYK